MAVSRKEMPARLHGQSQPTCREHPEQLPVRKERDVTAGLTHPCHDQIDTGAEAVPDEENLVRIPGHSPHRVCK